MAILKLILALWHILEYDIGSYRGRGIGGSLDRPLGYIRSSERSLLIKGRDIKILVGLKVLHNWICFKSNYQIDPFISPLRFAKGEENVYLQMLMNQRMIASPPTTKSPSFKYHLYNLWCMFNYDCWESIISVFPTQCEPLYGWGFRRGGYQCVCRPGFRYPHWQEGPFMGRDIESATEDEYRNGFDCIPVGCRFYCA